MGLTLVPPLLPCPLVQPHLEEVYVNQTPELGLLLHLHLTFPHHLVKHAGAPAAAWVVLHTPPNSPKLNMTVVWQNKTPTRLPEALWARFKPGPGAVESSSWMMHKMDSAISPSEVRERGLRRWALGFSTPSPAASTSTLFLGAPVHCCSTCHSQSACEIPSDFLFWQTP